MKPKEIMSYYCKQCHDIATSFRGETFALKSGVCSKHNIPLIPYYIEDMLDDLDEGAEALSRLIEDFSNDE